MNIGIKRKIKFKTLLTSVNIMLALLFLLVFISVNTLKLNNYAENSETELLEEYHSYLCDNFRECMYEVYVLRSFIERNYMSEFTEKNLNLIDPAEAERITDRTKEKASQLSVSGSVVRDFIIFGKTPNQRNLYCDVGARELADKQFPTVDLLQKVGLDGILHTHLGYMVKCTDEQLESVKKNTLSEQEIDAVRNMTDYLSGSAIVCDYIGSNLVIIRLNSDYISERFRPDEQTMFMVYNAAGYQVLHFGTDETDATLLADHIDMNASYFEHNGYKYAVSKNFYGKFSVVTVRKNGGISFSFAECKYVYFICIPVCILISLLFISLFSGRIFKKIERLHSLIIGQANSVHFEFMELEKQNDSKKKLSFSFRIFLTLMCSSLASLIVAAAAFNGLLESGTQNIVGAFGERLSHNYANEAINCYERYDSISTVKFERFIDKFIYGSEADNSALIRELEENFYYETTFLPGYSYAFIINANNEVLYQTMFSSQTQASGAMVRSALSKAKKSELAGSGGVFVSVDDLLSGDETLAFVKQIYTDGKPEGAVVIVTDFLQRMQEKTNYSTITDFLIADENGSPIIGSIAEYDQKLVSEGKPFDSGKKIFYSVDSSTEKWLGKFVVLTYNSFYLNQMRETQYFILINAFIIGIICVAATFFMQKVLTGPFSILMNSMNTTPTIGYQSIDETFNFDEIDAIASSYNKMLLRLKDLVEEDVRREAERRELEVLQAQTEFKMLQQQINPHFLFNTLECVNLLAITGGLEDISRIVKSLSMILRYGISRETKVKVGNEIKALQSYIDIQKYRFGDNYNVEFDLDESLFEVMMIKFILQPILENAISHGMVHTVEGGKIKITLRHYEEGIEFSIADNGVGMSAETLEALKKTIYSDLDVADQNRREGIGLKNVCRRIALYYGGKGSFIINSEEGSGTEVILRLPFD